MTRDEYLAVVKAATDAFIAAQTGEVIEPRSRLAVPLDKVEAAANYFLNETGDFNMTARTLAFGVAALLERDGITIKPDTIRTQYLPKLARNEAAKPVPTAPIMAVVKATLDKVICTKTGRWTERNLALAISHQMGLDGHALGSDQIRVRYLKEIIAEGHPCYDSRMGEWRYAPGC